jgi:hypothetical protein
MAKRIFELDESAFNQLDDAGKSDYIPAVNRAGFYHLDLDLPTGIKGVLEKERTNFQNVNRELAQLRAQFKDLDPEVAAALRGHETPAVLEHLKGLQTPLQRAEAELARVKSETHRVSAEAALCTALTVAGAAANEVLAYCKGVGLRYGAAGKVTLGEEEFPSPESLAVALRDRIPGLYSGSKNSGGHDGSGHGTPPANAGKPSGKPAAKASRAKMSLSDKTAFIKAYGTDKFLALPK